MVNGLWVRLTFSSGQQLADMMNELWQCEVLFSFRTLNKRFRYNDFVYWHVAYYEFFLIYVEWHDSYLSSFVLIDSRFWLTKLTQNCTQYTKHFKKEKGKELNIYSQDYALYIHITPALFDVFVTSLQCHFKQILLCLYINYLILVFCSMLLVVIVILIFYSTKQLFLVGLPSSPNVEELDRVLKRAEHLKLHPMSYLSALLTDLDDVTLLYSRLKFSGYDRDLAYFLVEHRGDKIASRPLLWVDKNIFYLIHLVDGYSFFNGGYGTCHSFHYISLFWYFRPYEKLVLNTKIKQKDAIEYVKEVLKYRGDELLKQFNEWEVPRFPISGKMLKDAGVPPGKMYGPIINKLKNIWIENEYKQPEEELIKQIPNIIEEFDSKKIKHT